MINKLTTKNVLLFLTLGGTFSLPNLFKASLNYSCRCFTIINGTQNFSELSFAILARILKSSQLRVTSELEVFDAVDFWVGCESRERLKFAKSLLLKVRLPLLSRHALKSVLKRTAHVDCAEVINDVLNETIKPPNRYCGQNNFDVLVCGGIDRRVYTGFVHHVDGRSFESCKRLTLPSKRREMKAAVVRGEVYFFGGFEKRASNDLAVFKYSLATGRVTNACEMYDDRQDYCVCALADKIYVVGGSKSYCAEFDTLESAWKEVAGTSEPRECPSCAAFDGRLVVTGGRSVELYGDYLRTVEAYDRAANEWLPLPSLNFARSRHRSAAMGDKLFVSPGFGHLSFEMFDKVSNAFAVLKSPAPYFCPFFAGLCPVGSKLVAFSSASKTVTCYDVESGEWTEEAFGLTENLVDFCCVKVPRL